jgi:hypothetical protein
MNPGGIPMTTASGSQDMLDLDNLKVSLTKNGYLKIAAVVAAYESQEMLSHCAGSIRGVNLAKSQVANVLCADLHTGMVPEFWDEVRKHDRATIQAFVFVAVVFAHKRLIDAFREAGHGAASGTLFRAAMSEKEFTNLQFAMAAVGLSQYQRGADQIDYDMTGLVSQLQSVRDLVGKLLRFKLRRCGWRDPEIFRIAPDLPLAEQCVHERFHHVLGMTEVEFAEWINWRPRHPR